MNLPGEKLRTPSYLEAAAAAKLRGLPVPASWAEIENAARALAVQTGAQTFEARTACRDLVAAARALDNVAQGAPEGGALARQRGLWGAATYAAGGNFPSANVVIARTHPRVGAQDAATATLLCALAPATRFKLRAQTPLAPALDVLFAGQTSDVLGAFDSVANTDYAPELWQLARAGLCSVAGSATILALADAKLPDGFACQLSAHIPTLLPPQLDAIRGGLLGGDNALAALPPGTGKTLLGELFLASSLASGRVWRFFWCPTFRWGAAWWRRYARTVRPRLRFIVGWADTARATKNVAPMSAPKSPSSRPNGSTRCCARGPNCGRGCAAWSSTKRTRWAMARAARASKV